MKQLAIVVTAVASLLFPTHTDTPPDQPTTSAIDWD